MNRKQLILRIGLVASLLGSLSACTVVPAYPVGYQHRPAYVETYPVYSYPSTSIYYESGYHRHYDGYGDRRYEGRRGDVPLPLPLQLHRDVRRSLGLPRLPGMP